MIETHTYKKAYELFEVISPWNNTIQLDGFIFRGHSLEEYQLTPTALRLESSDKFWQIENKPIAEQWKWESWQINAEYNILRKFYRLADQKGLEVPISEKLRNNLAQEFNPFGALDLTDLNKSETWLPPYLLEVAALAQHYGIPTRLLDWTYDPFIALYFAFRGALTNSGNIVIWCLNKEYLSFLKPTTNQINVNFITPHYAGNPNLNAQKGLFTHWPIQTQSPFQQNCALMAGQSKLTDRTPLDLLIKQSFNAKDDSTIIFKKLVIPCSEAKEGCQILDKLGYDTGRVFPGYDGIAKQILNKHLYW